MKTIEQWEKEKGLLFLSVDDLKKEVSEEDFMELVFTSQYLGCNHEDRVAFLKKNKYEVTRENMLNAELAAKG